MKGVSCCWEMCMLCRKCRCQLLARLNEKSMAANDTHLCSRTSEFRPVTLFQLPPRNHNCEDSHLNVCSGNSSDFYRLKEAVQSDKSPQWKIWSRLSTGGTALWKSVCLFIYLFFFLPAVDACLLVLTAGIIRQQPQPDVGRGAAGDTVAIFQLFAAR